MIRLFAQIQGNNNELNSFTATINLSSPIDGQAATRNVELFGCSTREEMEQIIIADAVLYANANWSVTLAPGETVVVLGL